MAEPRERGGAHAEDRAARAHLRVEQEERAARLDHLLGDRVVEAPGTAQPEDVPATAHLDRVLAREPAQVGGQADRQHLGRISLVQHEAPAAEVRRVRAAAPERERPVTRKPPGARRAVPRGANWPANTEPGWPPTISRAACGSRNAQ